MKNLAQYKKLYLMVLIEFLISISLIVLPYIIKAAASQLVLFYVFAYFPLFSIVYSILSYKYYKCVWTPFLIYSGLTIGIQVFTALLIHILSMTIINIITTSGIINNRSNFEILDYLLLSLLAQLPSILVSIAIVLILLLSFKTVNILRTKSKKS